jgi:hypothetical protein
MAIRGKFWDMSVKIERVYPRPGGKEYPVRTSRGYELVEPPDVGLKNKVEDATFVQSLEEAADLIERRGFSIRMGCPGKRPSLICPKSLRITRV